MSNQPFQHLPHALGGLVWPVELPLGLAPGAQVRRGRNACVVILAGTNDIVERVGKRTPLGAYARASPELSGRSAMVAYRRRFFFLRGGGGGFFGGAVPPSARATAGAGAPGITAGGGGDKRRTTSCWPRVQKFVVIQ